MQQTDMQHWGRKQQQTDMQQSNAAFFHDAKTCEFYGKLLGRWVLFFPPSLFNNLSTLVLYCLKQLTCRVGIIQLSLFLFHIGIRIETEFVYRADNSIDVSFNSTQQKGYNL